MIRVSDVVVGPIVFILFNDRNGQGGVLKVTKHDHFLVFLAYWIIFSKVLDKSGVAYVRTVENNNSVNCSCMPIFLKIYEQDWEGGVFKVMKNDHLLVF